MRHLHSFPLLTGFFVSFLALSPLLATGQYQAPSNKRSRSPTEEPEVATLAYSTYLGGGNRDAGSGIAVDRKGNIYVTGFTNSTNFPLSNALQPKYGGGLNDVYVAKYDPTGQELIYATYLGGSGADEGWCITVDSSGAAYVTGKTNSPDFPVVNAVQSQYHGNGDVFVTKISPDGSYIAYSTYIGGSDAEIGWGIAVDGMGAAFVTGDTNSGDFPTANAYQSSRRGTIDAFVTRLSPSGASLRYSTYLGGSGRDGTLGIAVDHESNAYVTGGTDSLDFPLRNAFQQTYGGGGQDIFVTKLGSSGRQLVYSTYVGGNSSDQGWAIAVSRAGNAYITGFTGSSNFPTMHPLQATNGGGVDAYATALDSTGTGLIYSTYLGGNGDYDGGYGAAVDPAGNATYTGLTSSSNFPIANAVQRDRAGGDDFFITKLNASGGDFIYSTYLGSSGGDYGYGSAADISGNSYVTGPTAGTDFPTANALQPTSAGQGDAAVVKISVPCTITFSDAGPGSPFYPYIRRLACFSIVSGYGDGTFHPNTSVTRGQIAKMVSAAVGLANPPGEQIFEDVPPGSWFYDAVQRLTELDAISGYECGRVEGEPCVPPTNRSYFRPSVTATRGQIAQIIATAGGFDGDPGEQTFEDVPADNAFYAPVQRLASRGIINGYRCGGENEPCVPPDDRPYFRWGANATRGQAAKMIANAFYAGSNP